MVIVRKMFMLIVMRSFKIVLMFANFSFFLHIQVTAKCAVTASVVKGRATDVIYLDFSKTFDTVPHNILLSKLEGYGFDKWTVQWMKNWLRDCTQRVVFSGSMSGWRPVASGVPQESVLGLVLFNIFINGINSGIECTLSKAIDDTKLCDAVDTFKEQDATWRDLCRPKQWAQVNLMRFNKFKCKILHLHCGKSCYGNKLGDISMVHNPAKKDLRWMASWT